MKLKKPSQEIATIFFIIIYSDKNNFKNEVHNRGVKLIKHLKNKCI